MRRAVLITLIVVALLLITATAAYAITNGQLDGDTHPYVGLVFIDAYIPKVGVVPAWSCSGSLIAPNVVLTAGHCTDGAVAARVGFDERLQNDDFTCIDSGSPRGGGEPTEGTPYTNPKYRSPENPYGGGNGLAALSYRDVGVVVLVEDVSVGGFAALPAPGLVDTLKNKTGLDSVGYGVQYQAQIPGVYLPQPPPYYRWAGYYDRSYAPSQLVSGHFVHSAEHMRWAPNPGGGSGGTRFGDSGGPDLLKGTRTVLGVNSYVANMNCSGVGYSARVGVPEILDWIHTFMPWWDSP